LSQSLGDLGFLHLALRETARAVEYYEEYLRLAREIGDPYAEGRALGHLGNAYFESCEVERAINFHEQHLDIARRIGDRAGECSALGNLGKGYALSGEPRRAIEFYEQALAGARELGDRHSEADSLFNLSLEMETLEDLPAAVARVEAALSIYEQISSPRADLARQQLDAWRATMMSDDAPSPLAGDRDEASSG
jgi:tetratricopeptide (TPR) repeat protein